MNWIVDGYKCIGDARGSPGHTSITLLTFFSCNIDINNKLVFLFENNHLIDLCQLRYLSSQTYYWQKCRFSSKILQCLVYLSKSDKISKSKQRFITTGNFLLEITFYCVFLITVSADYTVLSYSVVDSVFDYCYETHRAANVIAKLIACLPCWRSCLVKHPHRLPIRLSRGASRPLGTREALPLPRYI